ncbi:hypothetical protein V5O48_014114 [Marasmius crinis-equi]|uniref:Protein kinase domain-containing protein n=1 Tax=Marasmius crinis-equi TaxID=585013 RepID=A0ABR3EYB6_9AGAR
MSVYSPLQVRSAADGLDDVLRMVEDVLSDEQKCRRFLEVRGDEAQKCLDTLQLVDKLADGPNITDKLRSSILKMMLHLSKRSGLCPNCLIIKNVKKLGEFPVGGGGFGDVWKGKIGEQLVCLKVVKVYLRSDITHLMKEYMREAIVWQQLKHPNLLPFVGMYYLDKMREQLCLVSPWMERGDLMRYLKAKPRKQVDHQALAYDVAAGLSYLHEKKIVHGDLKSVNILVTPDERACIGDFGLSRVADSCGVRLSTSTSGQTRGTIRWLSPELLEPPCQSSTCSDLYAYACVCYEIFTGNVPFHELADGAVMVAVLLHKKYPSRPENVPELTDSMWEIMESCWAHEPNQRPTAENVLLRVGILRSMKTGELVGLQPAPDWNSLNLMQIWKNVTYPAVDTTALVRLLQKEQTRVTAPLSPSLSNPISSVSSFRRASSVGLLEKVLASPSPYTTSLDSDSIDFDNVPRSSRGSAHRHSPLSWTGETAIFDPTSNITVQPTSTPPSPLSHGLAAPHEHWQKPKNIKQADDTAISARTSSNRSPRKRKRGTRGTPKDTSEHAAYKRSRDRESDDDSDLGISVGVGGLTAESITISGSKRKTVRLKREYLLAQIRQKDAILESLLRQLHNPSITTRASYPIATSSSDARNPNAAAWLDRSQSRVQSAEDALGSKAFELDGRAKGIHEKDTTTLVEPNGGSMDTDHSQDSDDDDGDDTNNTRRLQSRVANETYFLPGPAINLDIRATLIEQHGPPEILAHGLVTPDDVERLFEIFCTRVNPFLSMLDPVIHTLSSISARCPFLFTVICAVSSRYYTKKSEIYPVAMQFAKSSAAKALVDGWRSVEVCQAYVLMSMYAVPAHRGEEDRSWLYTSLAIRIATDLNLDMLPTTIPQNEKQEREVLNRTRVWMICVNLDRSTATQFGRPSTVKEDYIVRNSDDWYKKSQYNLNYDVHLCAHTALLKIVARFHEEIFSDPSGLNKGVDFYTVTLKHDAYLIQFEEQWWQRFEEQLEPDDPEAAIRCSLFPFLVAYSRLFMFSFGFQQASQRGLRSGDEIFLLKCLESAKRVVTYMVDSLAPSGYMRYAPDGHFVTASFASAFLLKLLRPEFSSFLPKEEGSEIYQLVGKLIQTLSSPTLAIDDKHAPRMYARFLTGLLVRRRREGATVGRLQQQPSPPQQLQSREYGSQPSVLPRTSDGTETTVTSTPIFAAEATNTSNAGPIQFDADPTLVDFGNNGTLGGSDMLAAIQAAENPNWWTHMMMPGFSWPEAQSPPGTNYSIFHAIPQRIPEHWLNNFKLCPSSLPRPSSSLPYTLPNY